MSKKILIISPVSTHPPYSGNSKCILSYAEMLKEGGYDLFFLWVADHSSTRKEIELTQQYWKEKLIIYKLNQLHRMAKAFFRYIHFYRSGYYKADDFYPYGIKIQLAKIRKRDHFDCVIINYVFLSKIFSFFRDSKKILYTHDVFTNRFKHTGNPWFSVTANEEARSLDRADTVLAIQENEAIYYSYLTNRKVFTVYSFFPVHETLFTGRKVLLFMAGKNIHNIEAITDFIETVFKDLIRLHPGIKLLVGGSICKSISNIFKDDSIEFMGEVIDLNDFYSQGDIFINPTINGTGLKIKTFEAMAYGKVVISHPHNTLGIYKKEQAPILIAQNAENYLKHISMLFCNEEKIREFKKESIKYIMELNSMVKSRFVDVIEN